MAKAQPNHELDVAQQLLTLLDCPRALTVCIMLRYGHYDDIVALRAVPEDYDNDDRFFGAYQATRLLQKSEWLPTSFDKKQVALDSFRAAEAQCGRTNELLRHISAGTASFASPGVAARINRARWKIRDMLKRFSPYDFLDHCGFGPGADLSTNAGFTAAYNKLANPGSVTRGCSVFLDFMASNSSLGTVFQWDINTRSVHSDRVPGNKVAFVPKDCKTRRTIAVEPRWNVFYQKGMGRVLRRALHAAGVDLDDQSVNQTLARLGSLTGYWATLDLQSASDTVAYELVRLLWPAEWVAVLERLRSGMYFLDKKWHSAEKWSSMGNGYTFELESIIFYALCWSVCGSECSVYGDDLVVPTTSSSEIVELLNACGFILNSKKSFVTGPFRESCGGDYFNGVQVTPIYWKDKLNASGTLRLVNQVSRLASRYADGFNRHRRFRKLWGSLVHRLPDHLRVRGPSSVASCVHSPSGEWAKRAKWGWDGWTVSVWVPQSLRFSFKHYEVAVLSQFFQPSSDGYSIRDRIKYVKKNIFVPASGFVDIGTWK